MSDTISRQMAIDAMCEMMYHWFGGNPKDEIREIVRELKKLPVVQPDHNADVSKKVADGDCISRRVAIDTLHGYFDGMLETDTWSPCDVYGSIEMLPSVQPKQVCVATVMLTDEQVKEAVEKAKNAVVSVIESEPHWISCSERLPE